MDKLVLFCFFIVSAIWYRKFRAESSLKDVKQLLLENPKVVLETSNKSSEQI